MSESSDVEIAGFIKATTYHDAAKQNPKAYLFNDGRIEAWIPWSQISDYTEDADCKVETIFIPEWLALDKGFI